MPATLNPIGDNCEAVAGIDLSHQPKVLALRRECIGVIERYGLCNNQSQMLTFIFIGLTHSLNFGIQDDSEARIESYSELARFHASKFKVNPQGMNEDELAYRTRVINALHGWLGLTEADQHAIPRLKRLDELRRRAHALGPSGFYATGSVEAFLAAFMVLGGVGIGFNALLFWSLEKCGVITTANLAPSLMFFGSMLTSIVAMKWARNLAEIKVPDGMTWDESSQIESYLSLEKERRTYWKTLRLEGLNVPAEFMDEGEPSIELIQSKRDFLRQWILHASEESCRNEVLSLSRAD